MQARCDSIAKFRGRRMGLQRPILIGEQEHDAGADGSGGEATGDGGHLSRVGAPARSRAISYRAWATASRRTASSA